MPRPHRFILCCSFLIIGLAVTATSTVLVRDATSSERNDRVTERINRFDQEEDTDTVKQEQPQDRTQDQTQEEFTATQIEFFENNVRPLLVKQCYECHGPDVKRPEGGLSLASRKDILAGGDSGPAIDLEYPEDSNLLDAVQYGDLFEMPPSSKMADEEIEIFRKWIMDKAPWPSDRDVAVARSAEDFNLEKRQAEHWCWQPISDPVPPVVSDISWSIDPIDNFILAKLDEAGLKPAPTADRRTWIRRVTYDITGLPPTGEEIRQFLDDQSNVAFQKVVDRLLDSPRFGERWARHWMDLIRYAETYGHEFDYPIANAYQYRDYLIRAFNADVPYNDFLTEHIAGDLVLQPRNNPENQINESIVGTGFWFLGEATHGPVDVKGDEAGRIDNQIDVMSKTFLGLTVACARCHDHKFDAISAEDYYGLAGFLQSSRKQDVMLDPGRKIHESALAAQAASESADAAIRNFISKLDEGGNYFAEYSRYIEAAVPLLQSDDSWKLPKHLKIEGEALTIKEKSAGQARRQDIAGWSGGGQLWWTDANPGDTLDLELPIDMEGKYQLFANFTKANDFGIIKVFVNDHEVETEFDLYATRVERSGELELGEFDFEKGTQTLRLQLTGANDAAAKKYMAGIDFLVLKGTPSDSKSLEFRSAFDKACEKSELDSELLQRWINAIKDPATKKLEHPLYLVRKSAESNLDLTSDAADEFFIREYATVAEAIKRYEAWAKVDRPDGQVKNDPTGFHLNFDEWKTTGTAFDYWNGISYFNPVEKLTIGNYASDRGGHSGHLGPKFQGVLRSPTFKIESPEIRYFVNAKNARIRLVVDGFYMDEHNGLLFAEFIRDVNTDGQWRWIRQRGDLGNYIGHMAYIEFIDQGDGFLGIRDIDIGEVAPQDFLLDSHRIWKNHLWDKGQWEQARENSERGTPLEIVAGCTAKSIQAGDLFDVENRTILDPMTFDFMVRHKLFPNAPYKELEASLKQARQRLDSINEKTPAPMLAIGMTDGTPESEFVFVRGNHKNLGDMAPREPLTALCKDWDFPATTSGRLQLANNMTRLDHPLVRRVIVNRIWHHLTGRGLVASVDNFGVLGQSPSHPELLDYLANEFSDDGWSIKKMIRRIVLSKTYRMSSSTDPETEKSAASADPKNDLLYKFRIRRLQGEAIRDSMLAVSGQLNEQMYGPPVAIHLTPFMQGRGRPGRSGPLDGDRRRSIYTEVRRNFLPPMMLAFDTPIPFNSIGRRNNSNVPAQALILMNDPFVAEQAKHWAAQLFESTDEDDESRTTKAFVAIVGRPPTPEELVEFTTFIADQRTANDDKISDQQIWEELCHVLFNLKEFIYVK